MDAPAPLIPAATVILLRDAPSGLECLMLRRNRSLSAFGGMWVFPGGRVDAADAPGADSLARARAAAIRETDEETGLQIGGQALTTLSRWVPPVQEKRRFETWFFVGKAPEAPVKIDEGEIHDYRWICPRTVSSAVPDADFRIVPPTYMSLLSLAPFDTVDAALGGIEAQDNEHFETKFQQSEVGFVTLWEGDAGYETLQLDKPGPRRRLTMGRESWLYEG